MHVRGIVQNYVLVRRYRSNLYIIAYSGRYHQYIQSKAVISKLRHTIKYFLVQYYMVGRSKLRPITSCLIGNKAPELDRA